MKTTELTGAQLDYWTARADGIPADQLTIRRIQRSTEYHVVRTWTYGGDRAGVVAYSTEWGQGGPLIEKFKLIIDKPNDWEPRWHAADWRGASSGGTLLQAICRAAVRANFGDEVPDVTVQEAP